MTISTRFFGYAISISFDKTIRVPIDKLSNEFAARIHQEPELQSQSNQALIATVQAHDAISKPLTHTVR